MSTHDESLYDAFLDILLPYGGRMIVLRPVYMDESGTGKEHQFMSIAGYIFEAFESKRFARKWQQVLDEYGLPYAHMKDSTGPSGVYRHLDKAQCIALNKKLIALIKKHTLIGFSVSVDRKHYEKVIGGLEGFPSVYAFLVNCAISRVISWANKTNFQGRFTYVMEAGAHGQGEANAILDDISRCPEKSKRSRYHGHAFQPKEGFPPVQAADMLAWHVTKYIRDKDKGKQGARADFKALVRPQDFNSDYSESNVEEFKSAWSVIVATKG